VQLVFPIALRTYGNGLTVAETTGPTRVSAAADDPDLARTRLELRLIDRLERTHPSRLDRLGLPAELQHIPADAPLYRDRTAPETDAALTTQLDALLEDHPGGLRRLHVPALDATEWFADEDLDLQHALQLLAARLRSDDHTLRLHHALPFDVTVDLLTVEFDPLDATDAADTTVDLGPLSDGLLSRRETSATPTLETLAAPWSRAARRDGGYHIEPIVGRRDLLEDIRALVTASPPEPLVLVGPPRTGKTALVHHLAWQAGHPDADADLDDRDVWFADAARLTSPLADTDDWRTQCRRLFDELRTTDDILYLGSLAQTLDAGRTGEGGYSLANFLKPLFDDRRARTIAEATPAEWNDIERRHPGLARALQVVRVEPPTEAEGRRIFERAVDRLTDHRAPEFTDEALERIWRLHTRFASVGTPFGSAIDFADRLLRRAEQAFVQQLDEADVVHQFCRETGLPEALLRTDRTLELDDVRDQLSDRVMGQQTAVERVADVIGVTRADLGDPNRPLGVFFFVGPTGVGKTELAKALAELMFGDDDRLVRLDMSEYGTAESFGRLTGEAGGEGDLTGPVRRNPFSVVLLDEIEKAHDGVFDLLLQVFGDARLTDARGRTTPFQNTILVMTSNLGTGDRTGSTEPDPSESIEQWERRFRRAAEDHFRPEFLGRIDQFVPFRPLPRSVVADIAARELDGLEGRLGIRQLGVDLSIADDVPARVADVGWDPRYGARPIQRVVEQRVAWPVADELAHANTDEERPVAARIRADADDGFAIDVDITERTDAGSLRDELSARVQRVADLRRRTAKYLDSDLFAELERRITDYDQASREQDFWEGGGGAEAAQQAQRARELVGPSRELLEELETVEDLAREAYHTRSRDLGNEVAHQIEDRADDVRELFLTLLGLPLDDPNRMVLFLPSEQPEDPWRNNLVEYYQTLADRAGWSAQLWQGKPAGERDRSIPLDGDFSRGELWRTQRSPQGRVVAVEFQSKSVRAFLLGEPGRHRQIVEEEEETSTRHVYGLPAGIGWPHPDSFRPGEETPAVFEDRLVRTWNTVGDRVTTEGFDSVDLEEDPWPDIIHQLDHRAWEEVSWS
jgi:ATP-dependent Clp protease ATP-binding subunit ClpA